MKGPCAPHLYIRVKMNPRHEAGFSLIELVVVPGNADYRFKEFEYQ